MQPFPAPTMNKKNSGPKPRRRNPVHAQRSNKESRNDFFSSHVGRAMNAHEEVWNGKPSIQEGKEATGHSSGLQ
jgi:hypothetical protein